MIDVNALKIAVLSCFDTQVKLKSCLAGVMANVSFFEDGDATLNSVIRQDFDVLLVDGLHPQASRICRSVYSSIRPPVGLLVSPNASNWNEFGSWDVDGFISADASSQELLARLKAIARRPAKKLCVSVNAH
jgi:hypothetical protein